MVEYGLTELSLWYEFEYKCRLSLGVSTETRRDSVELPLKHGDSRLKKRRILD